jgi:hypothetical protein
VPPDDRAQLFANLSSSDRWVHAQAIAKWLWNNEPRRECEQLSLPKMLSGANAFEISDIQEDETELFAQKFNG